MDEATIKRIRQIRADLMLELYGAGPVQVSFELLVRRLSRVDPSVRAGEVAQQIGFLRGQGLASEHTDAITGEHRYSITSRGMLVYENGGE